MDVDKVLQHLVKCDKSLPAIKLAWNCELDLEDCTDNVVPRISPSHYKNEILLSTSERYSLLCRQQRKFEFHKSGFEIIATPSIVVFQNFTIGQKYSTRLSLRNIGKMSQKATFFMDESNGFSFEEGSNKVAKFAPGMTVTININFVPEEDTDYFHKIVISTRSSRFAVPIMGIGSRGIIDLPDVFDFGNVPVKVLKKKCVMAYNTGSETARFTLTTDGSFSVKPERGVVAPKDSFPLEISFIAEIKNDYEGYVLIKYDNDEEVHCVCKANAIDADICVTPNKICFEDTYLGLKSKKTLVIFNNSDEVLDFQWIKYLTSANLDNNLQEEFGGGDNTRVKWQYVIGSGGRESHRHLVTSDSQLQTSEIENAFYNENIFIEPLLGKIQPHSSIDILIVFAPTTHIYYQVDAFLSITGLQEPVNVPIIGHGLGPEFRLAYKELDIGHIFVGGSHAFEIAVVNTGQIEGSIKFDKIVSSGKNVSIKVEPEKIILSPDQYGAFYLNLVCCGQLGDFVEKLRFTVIRANMHHILSIRGKKEFPSMHFSLPEIDFGDIAYSFPKTKQVLLINDSLNTVSIVLGIKESGTDEPIDFNQLLAVHQGISTVPNEEKTKPREFTLEPKIFSLPPRGFKRISVTLCGNKCRKITTEIALCVAIEGGEGGLSDPLMTLPIRAYCKTPTVHNANPDLHFHDAFLHFSNTGELSIKNTTDLSGCYLIVPVASHIVKSEWTKLVGIVNPNSLTAIPFTFTPSNAGESSANYDLYLLGKDEKVMTLNVKITAVAAKLAVSSKKIDFGNVNLLTPTVQVFDIINDSPLTIPFTVLMLEGGGENGDSWVFEPEAGIIQPDSMSSIDLRVTLKEVGVHNALARVQMQEAANYIDLKLTACGVGACLIFTPSLDNPGVLDFKQMFTKTVKTFTVEVTNMGHSPKILEWLHSKDDPPIDDTVVKRFQRGPASAKHKKKIVKPAAKRENVVFIITPQKKVLAPMASTTISFTATSQTKQVVTEEHNLWSYSPKEPQGNKRVYEKRVPRRSRVDINGGIKPYQESYKPTITQSLVLKASFETPQLVFSRKSILFQIDAFPSQTDFIQEDVIKIENKGTLPLMGEFQTRFPFSMKMKHSGIDDAATAWTHTFAPGDQFLLTIVFDGQHLRKDRGSYRFEADLTVQYIGHSESETIPLKGEVNFPQVQIDRDIFELGVIGNGTEAVEEFSVTNPCNFCLSYKWYIKPRSTEIEYEPGEMDKLCFELECEENIKDHVRSRISKRQRKRDKHSKGSPNPGINSEMSLDEKSAQNINPHNSPEKQKSLITKSSKRSLNYDKKGERRKSETKHSRKRSIWNRKKSLESSKNKKDPSKELDHYGDWVQFVRNKFLRTRMMETVGLHDIAKEKEDESNYLAFNKVEPKTINNFAISQLIDIVPLAGIIQAGQTQNFVLVFYGHSNVKLKTTAICYIEGGTSKSIQITAQSTHLEDSEVPESTSDVEEQPSPVEITPVAEEKPKVIKQKPKKVSVPEEDSGHEVIDNFKHRCTMRPTFVKKNKIKVKKAI